jgi:SAM-dependent methyltransferase
VGVVSELAGLLPPNLRRTVAGAWLDLKSLPDRLRNPARWDEPFQAIHNVGGGDFDQMGKVLLNQLATFASLSPDSDVLDIGCGTGRLAKPLSEYLRPSSTYIGFDVSLTAIVSCRRRIGRRRPNFTFVKADIANREYNPLGHISEEEYCFPADDESVDVVAAFSVFSHMVQRSIDRYLLEAHRVLRSGGSFAFTAYALTPERIEAINHGEGRFRFRPWSDGAMVLDHRSPERAIAHTLDHLVSAIAASGLRLQGGFHAGSWLGSPTYDGGQDLFILTKA